MTLVGGAQEAAPRTEAAPQPDQTARTDSGLQGAAPASASPLRMGGASTPPPPPGDAGRVDASRPPPDSGPVDLGHSLVVDDDVAPGPAQIRRSDLLSRGAEVVRRAADEELAAVGRSTDTCPYIAAWLQRFGGYPAGRLERAVVLFSGPSTTSVDGYLQAVEARVRRSVRAWISSGRVELPTGLTSDLPGGEVAALRRSGEGPAPDGGDTRAVVSSLGPGRALPGSARIPMERAFGADFSTVRVHTDGAAADANRAQRHSSCRPQHFLRESRRRYLPKLNE